MRKCKRSTIVGPFIHVCIIVCVQVELDPATQPGHSRGVSAFVTASKIQKPTYKASGWMFSGESMVLCGSYRTMLYVGTNTVTAVNDCTASEQFVHQAYYILITT